MWMGELMRGIGRIKRLLYGVRRQLRPGGVILLYHRVVDLPDDPYNLAVSPERFARQLDYIQQTCHPMRLLDLAEAIRQRALPHRAVAITFDDGYADNYRYAFPLLKAAGVPATVFVTTGQLDNPNEFWWDELERLLLQPTSLPPDLRATVRGEEYVWHLGSRQQRYHVQQALHGLLRPLDAQEQQALLDDLAAWAGLARTGRRDYRAMTADELLKLGQSDYVDIGGHTVTHPSLSGLSADMQYAEITRGRQGLETLLGTPVLTFAYPYGAAGDFTDETVGLVQAAGFQVACTTLLGSVESGNDPFRLRRCPVFNWDAEDFRQRLETYFVTPG
jgi:peptidoglycan/xylan/chitin deacetylase (PgdA/CDA1 family)